MPTDVLANAVETPAVLHGATEEVARILSNLNDAQLAAVTAPPGALLCLAGAGSGKTRVLTSRIAYMIRAHGLRPEEVLAVTFTRKAAGEMRERLAVQLGAEDAAAITLGTFHAVGSLILRERGNFVGLSGRFSIIDDIGTEHRVRRILSRYGIEPGNPAFAPRIQAELITALKGALSLRALDVLATADEPLAPNDLLVLYRTPTEEDVALMAAAGDYDVGDAAIIQRLYADYNADLLGDNCVDYQDLLSLVLLLFLERPDVLEAFRDRWKFVAVDEYQDTDRVQDALLRLLAGDRKNLTVVGDGGQAIYGWRGAHVENIRTFEERYGARCVRLERNYRSSSNIIELANAALSAQNDPGGMVLRPVCEAGPRVRLWTCASADVEADAVATDIRRIMANGSCQPKDIFVLYRANALALPLERAFRRAEVPYQLVGGTRFAERKEIRELVGYLRLALNPRDNGAFELVVNAPRRNIGPATVERILQAARLSGRSALEVAANPAGVQGLQKPQVAALAGFATIMRTIASAAARGPAPAVHAVLRESHYRDQLIDQIMKVEEEADEVAIRRVRAKLDAVDEFALWAEEWQRDLEDRHAALDEEAVLQFLDSLLTERPDERPEERAEDRDGGHVSLMTVHGAKGLEAKAVYVIGLEDGVFPVTEVENEDDERLAEEGRLFYVAITRAMRYLVLSHARYREVRYGEFKSPPISRFLYRLPDGEYRMENRD